MGVGMASEALENTNISPMLGTSLGIGGGLILVVLSVLAFFGLRRLPRASEGSAETDDPVVALDESSIGS
jgi:hypothetical protein